MYVHVCAHHIVIYRTINQGNGTCMLTELLPFSNSFFPMTFISSLTPLYPASEYMYIIYIINQYIYCNYRNKNLHTKNYLGYSAECKFCSIKNIKRLLNHWSSGILEKKILFHSRSYCNYTKNKCIPHLIK